MIAASVVAIAVFLAWFIRAIRRENHRQNHILNQFDREHPVREPGYKRVRKEEE